MPDFHLTFRDAFKIVEARDPGYAADIRTLLQLLHKMPLDCWLPAIGDIPQERVSEYIANRYRNQVISRAEQCVRDEFVTYMKQVHPTISIREQPAASLPPPDGL